MDSLLFYGSTLCFAEPTSTRPNIVYATLSNRWCWCRWARMAVLVQVVRWGDGKWKDELRGEGHGWGGVVCDAVVNDIAYTPQLTVHDLQAPDDATKMDQMQLINEIWLDQPKEKHLHICVRLPAIRSKHTIPGSMDVHSQLKRAKLANGPPSFLAESQNYNRLQRNSRERLLDDRPEPDRDVPPVPLLYPGFGHFLDIVDGCDNVPGLADVKVAELRKAVDRTCGEDD
ncbi:hypothetical protein EDB86DRAFT_1366973 [Lactarius hatsudake]|nr:hypothetical protein EDB86DRAFT_1366973 [Lactarius hatsudake]